MPNICKAIVVAVLAGTVFLSSTCGLFNKAPSIPVISGPSAGVVGVPVEFTATATDPEGDSVAFQFAWGDGDTSSWSALLASGETTEAQHTFSDSGAYEVRAKARDDEGSVSALGAAHSITVLGAGPGYPDTIVGEIGLPRDGYKGVVTPDGILMYVTHPDGGFVSCTRLADRTVSDTILVGREPKELAVDPAGSYVYVQCQDDSTLVKVRVSDNAVMDSVLLGANLGGVAVSPDGQFVYSACGGSSRLYATRASDMVLVDSAALSSGPADVVIAQDGGEAYVSLLESKVAVVGLPELDVQAEIVTAEFPDEMVLSPDGAFLYVETQGDSGLAVVKTATREVVATIRISGRYYYDLAVLPPGRYVTATDYYGIRYVDTQALALVDSLHYPGGYGHLAVHPTGDTIYVIHQGRAYMVGRR